MGNNNNVGGLERNSLILYKWGLESFILYMWGASKEIPPFPIYGGIISRSPHVLHVGGFERNPPFLTYGGIISRSPMFYMWGGLKKIFTHYMWRAETEIPHPPFVGGL